MPAISMKKEEDTEDDDSIECVGVVLAPPSTSNSKSKSKSNGSSRPRKLRDNDVIMLHGETTLEHPGNDAYQRLINLNRGLYANAKSLMDQLHISKSIVASIRQDNGRFLEREDESLIITRLENVKWRVISDGKAAELTLNELREAGLKPKGHRLSSPAKSALPVSMSRPPPEPPKETKSAESQSPPTIDPALLIELTTAQAAKMKYPIGCPIWYNIHLDSGTQDVSKKYSSLGEANLGIIKSVSMDISTRKLLYKVSPANTNEGEQEKGRLIAEDDICYASKCPVHVQLEETMEGEIITCCFSNGWTPKTVEKSYMVSVVLKDDQIRIYQGVDGDKIKYRPDPEPKPTNANDKKTANHSQLSEKENAKKKKERQKAESNFQDVHEKDAREMQPNESKSAGRVLQQRQSNGDQCRGQPTRNATSAPPPNQPLQATHTFSSISDTRHASIKAKPVTDDAPDQTSSAPKSSSYSSSTNKRCSSLGSKTKSSSYPSSTMNRSSSLGSKTKPDNVAQSRELRNPTIDVPSQNLSHPKPSNSSLSLSNRSPERDPNSSFKRMDSTNSTRSSEREPNSSFKRTNSTNITRNSERESNTSFKRIDNTNSIRSSNRELDSSFKRIDSTNSTTSAASKNSRSLPPSNNTPDDFSRKRQMPAAPALSKVIAGWLNPSQRPSKCLKAGENDATKKNIPENKTINKSEYSRLVSTSAEHGKKGGTSRMIYLPPWLTSNDSSCKQVLDALNRSIPNIYQSTGYTVKIDERSVESGGQIILAICANNMRRIPDEYGERSVLEMIENSLMQIIGAEASRGRLLYDIARSCATMKGIATSGYSVFQRNPLNSSQRIWMTVVDLPNEMISQGEITENVFLGSHFQDSIHQARCNLIVCKDNFNVKLIRCHPYVLILGNHPKNLEYGVALTRKLLKQVMANLPSSNRSVDQTEHCAPVKSALHTENPTVASSPPRRLSNLNPRKVMIPVWLLSDELYLKAIEDGLFGIEWCKEQNFNSTGCQLIRSQQYLLIKPYSHLSSIWKATNMIEDALLDVLGASESKCMLLYDLTKSYSTHPLDGIINMRNPLDSIDWVWANVLKLSHYDNQCMSELVAKHMDDEMHRLGCTLKICTDSFGIQMRKCDPYVMVMGRHKNNVSKAIGYVQWSIKRDFQSKRADNSQYNM